MTPGPPTGQRCLWAGIDDGLYARYHDEEWGVPHADSRKLFEKLCLEGFQAGLSWLTILRKRDGFRQAFANFDPVVISRFGPADVERLMADPGIVRNRAKIAATIDNAKALLRLEQKSSLASLVWGVLDGRPAIHSRRAMAEIPAETDASRRLSKALKSEGFRFVGPTTVYAFMQSSGMVNDHLVTCPRHEACAQLQARFEAPPP